jgi:hypothetical protein
MSKKLIQRNLSLLATTYTILGSWYSSLEDNPQTCANCGRVICNIAEVQDADGNKFMVGMDCAETLVGVKDSFDFSHIHKACFAQAKQARAKLLKAKKEGATNFSAKTFTDTNNFYKQIGSGKWDYSLPNGGANWKQYPAEVWGNYVLPMIKDLVTTIE